MAQFRGLIITNRGQVSRLGHKTTGLRLTANGWNVGCEVHLEHVDGVDTITVYKKGGSSGRASFAPWHVRAAPGSPHRFILRHKQHCEDWQRIPMRNGSSNIFSKQNYSTLR